MKLFFSFFLSLCIITSTAATKTLNYRFSAHFATRHFHAVLDNPEQLEKLIKRNIQHIHDIQQLSPDDCDPQSERLVLQSQKEISRIRASKRETEITLDDANELSRFFGYYIIVRTLPDSEQFAPFIARVTPLLEQRLPAGALQRLFP